MYKVLIYERYTQTSKEIYFACMVKQTTTILSLSFLKMSDYVIKIQLIRVLGLTFKSLTNVFMRLIEKRQRKDLLSFV